MTAEKIKQIPKTRQHQLGPVGTRPWSLKPPQVVGLELLLAEDGAVLVGTGV